MYDFKKIEKEILKFWGKNKIYEKVKNKNKKGKKVLFFARTPIYFWENTYRTCMEQFSERHVIEI